VTGPGRSNLLTVAVEDYFQAAALNPLVSPKQWTFLDSHVEENTRRTLDFLDRFGHHATFFVLGWVADRMPGLVREIADRGHEVASKGYLPMGLHEMSRNTFREDVLKARACLERATGREILGHRVAKGHLTADDLWALDILAELGFSYDSSVYPRFRSVAREPWRRFPHWHQHGEREILELPLSTWGVGSLLMPVAGGNYMRQLPPRLMHLAMKHWVESYESPFNMYFHVWELDPELPRIASAGWIRRIRQYRNLRRMPEILGYYLERYRFETIASFLELEPQEVDGERLERRVMPRIPQIPRREDHDGRETAIQSIPLTIIVPCCNEERSLPYLFRILLSVRKSLGPRYLTRLMFIDDGSTDGTFAAIGELFGDDADCDIIRHDRNRGIAAAIVSGIENATTEIVCSIDCDGSYDPHQLAGMIPLLAEDVAMVTASPYHPLGETVGVPQWRLALSRGLSRMYAGILNHRFSTYTSCFRVYRRSMVQDLHLKHGDFLGVLETFIVLDERDEKLVEYPAVLESRLLGYSKMKTLRTIIGHLSMLFHVCLRRIYLLFRKSR